MKATSISGVVPILVTPVTEDGQLAEDDLCRQVDFLVHHGATAFGFGYGSEPSRFTESERDRALFLVTQHTSGRALVIAQLQAGSTAAAIDRGDCLMELGADLLMIPAPASESGELLKHYAAIGQAVNLPIVVQDAVSPGFTELSVSLLAQLVAEVEQISAIKIETAPTAPKIAAVVDAVGGHASVLGGSSGLDFFNELERGSNGTMPGPSLVDIFARIWTLHRTGDRDEARRVFSRLLPILTLAFRSPDTFFHVEKEILLRRGAILSAALRAPAPSMEPGLSAELDVLCEDLAREVPELVWTYARPHPTPEVR